MTFNAIYVWQIKPFFGIIHLFALKSVTVVLSCYICVLCECSVLWYKGDLIPGFLQPKTLFWLGGAVYHTWPGLTVWIWGLAQHFKHIWLLYYFYWLWKFKLWLNSGAPGRFPGYSGRANRHGPNSAQHIFEVKGLYHTQSRTFGTVPKHNCPGEKTALFYYYTTLH